MQISSSTSQPLSQTTPMPPPASKPAPPPDSTGDSADLHRVSDLIATLQTTPPIRPEAVARGMALASDPGYPPAELVQKLAGLIAGTNEG